MSQERVLVAYIPNRLEPGGDAPELELSPAEVLECVSPGVCHLKVHPNSGGEYEVRSVPVCTEPVAGCYLADDSTPWPVGRAGAPAPEPEPTEE